MNWFALVVAALLWTSRGESNDKCKELSDCLEKGNKAYVVSDNFNDVIKVKPKWETKGHDCIIFLKKNPTTRPNQTEWCNQEWPQLETKNDTSLLRITKWHIKRNLSLTVLLGENYCRELSGKDQDLLCNSNHTSDSSPESCRVRSVQTDEVCKGESFDENVCIEGRQNKYIVNITRTHATCVNCNNPVKHPEKAYSPDELRKEGLTINVTRGEDLDPVQASNVMKKMGKLATSINTPSAALNMGEGVTGIIVRETNEEYVDEVSFAYESPNNDINIIENRDSLAQFSRSVTVSKEAFEQAINLNVSVPFAAMIRFNNLSKDELNSTILGNEVLAVDMGAKICNLTDTISIHFWNATYEGNASCRSWNGDGSRPNWTADGCLTIQDGENITCECSHLTFFAILLTPLNETISSSDLNNLTIITQIGCSLSIFFISIILFMHFLLRRTKASTSTRILIHLVSAMFLLNLTFLTNHYIAKLNSSVGCVIMAAAMHYFMLATFTWFAVKAFHLCLQLYMGGKIVISHYILKVSIISWVLPSFPGIVLLIKGKYGEQVIYTNDPEENVAMCWITDSEAHYIVNIGYYALVFVFTFTTFVIILSWLCCLRRPKSGNSPTGTSGRNILIILGLCSMLGITWGFAFFAYGALLIPSYYIFTVLNSFQGFFLFIYYYKTSQVGNTNADSSSSTDSSSTLGTLVPWENPYGQKINPAKIQGQESIK
ncbi:adhesion G-protein coupled receptor G5 [Labrus bergylta]|uniref:adhesion G-protein coupled receptor G5 n=1 Tax=Labrus bergylta TaxID=56723 RepID=UPI0033132000